MNFLSRVVNRITGKANNNVAGSAIDSLLQAGATYDIAEWSFVGDSLSKAGPIVLDKKKMYEIHQSNKMAFSYTQKISQMVAQKGIRVKDSNMEEVKAERDVETVMELVGGDEGLDDLVHMFFDEAFANGQVFAHPRVINGLGLAEVGEGLSILDGRNVTKKVDEFGRAVKYINRVGYVDEVIAPEELLDYIAYRDIQKRRLGISLYNTIAVDAVIHAESGKTQMYYFRNKAVPNLFVMLDPDKFKGPDGVKKKEEFDALRENKFKGSENSGKFYSTSLAKDVKVLDINNVDLDIINLRKESDEAFSAVFMLDKRLVGMHKETGSYGEVETTTIRQGNEQIDAYGIMFSRFLTAFYKKFVNPNFEYQFVAENGKFKNEAKEKEVSLNEVKAGVLSRKMYADKYGIRYQDGHDEMLDKHILGPEYISANQPLGSQQ